MNFSRRTLLVAGAASVVTSATSVKPILAQTNVAQTRSNPIGISTYSFWQFEHEEYRNIEKCIDLAAEWGFDGV